MSTIMMIKIRLYDYNITIRLDDQIMSIIMMIKIMRDVMNTMFLLMTVVIIMRGHHMNRLSRGEEEQVDDNDYCDGHNYDDNCD